MNKKQSDTGLLDARNEKIKQAKEYLNRTKILFSDFGSEKLEQKVEELKNLDNSLNFNNEVKIVVLGEFSRGKSSLVNALLNIKLLPTSLEATTAINTFIRALPNDKKDRFIRIHYIDPKKHPDEIQWNDDTALKKWGTELDSQNADLRKELDYIEVFMDHPLLKEGLILVDTPGLESVMEHHEAITRKAISEAHIALWVQNTTQLGGASTEWEFLKKDIKSNFKKFITVVNCWDMVLEPQDDHEKLKPTKQREEEKLSVVKNNFIKNLGDTSEFRQLIDNKHLIPVSALWALDKSNPEHQKLSGIDKLASRISELFSTGEALEQIYIKPLKQLTKIQNELQEHIQNELDLLDKNKSKPEYEQQREIDLLNQQIKDLENDSQNAILEFRGEHSRSADSIAREFERDVVTPLIDLKNDIEMRIDERYVRSLILSNSKKIGLPTELDEQFKNISVEISATLKSKQNLIKEALEGLRGSYANKMSKFVGKIQNEMSNLNLEIPDLDVSLNIDFSVIESYHTQQMQLKQEMEDQQNKLDDLELGIAINQFDTTKLEIAKRAVRSLEIQISQLGEQPSPYSYTTTKRCLVESNTWFPNKYADVPVTHTDDSNVRVWREAKDKLDQDKANKEAAVDALIAEQQRMYNIKMTKEAARKKVERELKKRERELNELLQKQSQDIDNLVRETTQKLRSNTAGQLDKKIKYISNNVLDSVRIIFSNQMDYLERCVKEQYLESLNAKCQQLEKVLEKIKQGEEAIASRKEELLQGKKNVSELLHFTENALNSVGL